MIFDHWALMNGKFNEPGKLNDTILKVRERKGLKKEIPPLDEYYDKL